MRVDRRASAGACRATNATPSRIVSASKRARFSAGQRLAAVQEAVRARARVDDDREPSRRPTSAQKRSIGAVRGDRVRVGVALRRERHAAAVSRRRRPGSRRATPARAASATTRLDQRRAPPARPAAAPSSARGRTGSRRPRACGGRPRARRRRRRAASRRSRAGTRRPTSARSARVSAGHRARPEERLDDVPGAQARPERRLDEREAAGERAGGPLRRARSAARRGGASSAGRCRSSTGQAVAQRPSTAHVSSAVVREVGLERGAERGGRRRVSSSRAISRRTTMRWRGVSVRSRLGHCGSQKPHSMHLSTSSSTVGQRLQVREVRARVGVHDRRRGSGGRPGRRAPSARFMTAYASAPHSVSTNGAMFRPVPCSALSAPSYFPTTSVDDVVHEAGVLVDGGLVVERLREDEVQVPVLARGRR